MEDKEKIMSELPTKEEILDKAYELAELMTTRYSDTREKILDEVKSICNIEESNLNEEMVLLNYFRKALTSNRKALTSKYDILFMLQRFLDKDDKELSERLGNLISEYLYNNFNDLKEIFLDTLEDTLPRFLINMDN